jgi:hypothetical protein
VIRWKDSSLTKALPTIAGTRVSSIKCRMGCSRLLMLGVKKGYKYTLQKTASNFVVALMKYDKFPKSAKVRCVLFIL